MDKKIVDTGFATAPPGEGALKSIDQDESIRLERVGQGDDYRPWSQLRQFFFDGLSQLLGEGGGGHVDNVHTTQFQVADIRQQKLGVLSTESGGRLLPELHHGGDDIDPACLPHQL